MIRILSRKRLAAPILLVLCMGTPLERGHAATVAGVNFADRRSAPGAELALQCTAILKYMMFIDVYAAGLYLGEGVSIQKVLDDVPKRLEIEYFYPISAEDFVRATEDSIAVNVDADTFTTLQSSIERMNALYEDVSPGDRYALTYIPGVGTELTLNGVSKGTVPGSEFATAIFSIWLGPRPIDDTLKRDLLSCS